MRILLVQTAFIGDVILSSAVFRELKRIYPDSSLTVMTTPAAEELVKYHPDVNETIVYDKRGRDKGLQGFLRLRSLLEREKFDLAISLHKSYRTAFLLYFSRIPLRYGFREASASWLYNRTASRSDLSHEVLRNLAILRNLNVAPEATEASLHIEIPPDVREGVAAKLRAAEGSPVVAMAPGSVWATKRWPTQYFAEVARRLVEKGYWIVVLGREEDRGAAAEIEQAASGRMTSLVGTTTLLEATAAVDMSQLLIANDSAPLHLASARGTPVVAIFCATSPALGFGPWKVPSENVGLAELFCRPCGAHGGDRCPRGTAECQWRLMPEVVFQAALRLLRPEIERRA